MLLVTVSPAIFQMSSIRFVRLVSLPPAKSDRATGEIIDVDKEEAEAMLTIIELLCDHHYVMPAKAKHRHQQLKEKLEASKANPTQK